MISRLATLPACISATSSLKEAPCSTGLCATGSMRSSVAPGAPSLSLIACTSACISAGWSGRHAPAHDPICRLDPSRPCRPSQVHPNAERSAGSRLPEPRRPMQFLRPSNEMVVRHRANQRWRRLDRIKPAHLLCAARIAARGEVAGKAQMSRCRTQKIAVDGQDYVRTARFGTLSTGAPYARWLHSVRYRGRPAPIGASAPPDRASSASTVRRMSAR